MFHAKVGGKFAALCIFDSDTDIFANSLEEGYLQQLKRSLGDMERRFNLGSQRSFGSVRPETAAETEVHKH